jgi:hypothetical protein
MISMGQISVIARATDNIDPIPRQTFIIETARDDPGRLSSAGQYSDGNKIVSLIR